VAEYSNPIFQRIRALVVAVAAAVRKDLRLEDMGPDGREGKTQGVYPINYSRLSAEMNTARGCQLDGSALLDF